jgi:hypothetical protein
MDSCSTFSSTTDLSLVAVVVVLLDLRELLVLTVDVLEVVLLVVTVGILEVAAAVVRSAARSSANISSKSASSASCRASFPFLPCLGILCRLSVMSEEIRQTHMR